jgi:predicted GNAT superfamily acetyltransferase
MTEMATELAVERSEALLAMAAAQSAAKRAGVEVRELRTLREMTEAADLVDSIWSGDHVPVNLQRAVAHAGSYLAGALRDGRVVGVLIGFLGLHGGGLSLHSHVAGVLAGDQGRSVGFALKVHQRAWALERDVRRVTWTFDPLVRRNAYFNLTKLGAVGARYEANFYGTMHDGINNGDESDRLVVEWRLDRPGVAEAAAGHPRTIDVAGLRRTGAGVILEVGADGAPAPREADGEILLCQVPEDIVALRTDAEGRALARRWRGATRAALEAAFDRGLEASAMSRTGWYVLTPRDRA